MVKVENILWTTDFSKDATHALGYARSLAELFRTRLYLLHVIDNPTSSLYGEVSGDYLAMEANARTRAQAMLQEATTAFGSWQDYESLVREGDIYSNILDVIRDKRIGTIVMGTHGRTGLKHLLLGSIAEKVVRTASCPVYVTRHPDRATS